jgi:hypothetical protein
MKHLLISSLLVLPLPAWAESSTPSAAYRNSLAQEEVRAHVSDTKAELMRLLEEFQANGLSLPEMDRLTAAVAQLGDLEDEKMRQLIERLREAGAAPSREVLTGQLGEVSREQKTIGVLLRTLSDDLQRQQDAASLSVRLSQLILRQAANLRQTDVLVAGEPGSTGHTEALRTLVPAEQTAIRGEIELLSASIARHSGGTDSDSDLAKMSQEWRRADVQATAKNAVEALNVPDYARSKELQASLLSSLQMALLRLQENLSAEERLQDLAMKMQNLSEEQARLSEATKRAGTTDQGELLEAQNLVRDKYQALRTELASLSPEAATAAEKASEVMDESARTLADAENLRGDARKELSATQQDAATALASASRFLSRAAENLAAEREARETREAMVNLEKIAEDVAALQTAVEELPANAASDQLAKEASELQDLAGSLNPAAAENLAAAASQLAAGESSAASQSIAGAAKELKAQSEALAQQAALQALAGQITEALQASEEAAAALQSGSSEAAVPTEAALDALEGAREAAAAAGGQSETALTEAGTELAASRAALGKDSKAALAANGRAQDQLKKALAAIGDAMAALPVQGGLPSGGSPAGGSPVRGGLVAGGTGSGPNGNSSTFMAGSGDRGRKGEVREALSPRQREAASLLAREAPPPEYQNMARQYLRNLASGEFPATPVSPP